MFTGLVELTGRLVARRLRGRAGALWLQTPAGFTDDVATGDSICVGGTCLTALDSHPRGFRVDVSAETLDCTTLGRQCLGAALNLEKSLRPNDRLGGHFVSGHVDDTGRLLARERDGDNERWRIEMPPALSRLIAAKGSIAVDGVSLTVNQVDAASFWVNLIPHTLAITSLGRLQPGAAVNLEADLLARYLQRWHDTGGSLDDPTEGLYTA